MCADVFISYSSADYEVAQEVEKALESSGLSVFDTHAIAAGNAWVTNLDEAFNSSKALVVLISTNYSSSPYTASEWSAAISRGKPVVPVVVERGARVPAVLAPYTGIDVSRRETRNAKLQLLADQLARLTSIPAVSTADQMNSMKTHLTETRRMQRVFSEAGASAFAGRRRYILVIGLVVMLSIAVGVPIALLVGHVQGWLQFAVGAVVGGGTSAASVAIVYFITGRHLQSDGDKDATMSAGGEGRR